MPVIFLRKCLKCPSFRKCHRNPRFPYIPRPCMLGKLRPAGGRYYDLVRVPHGHVPVPRVKLWARLPLPVREFRDYDFYSCPECGAPSFFKINGMCQDCEEIFEWDMEEAERRHVSARLRRRLRRKYFKGILKRLECLLLPVLLLAGKVWYVQSRRLRYVDSYGEYDRD